MRFSCTICHRFASSTLKRVVRHIGSVHSFEPGFQITCGVNGCARTYTNFRSFQKHLTRQHQAAFEKNTTDDSTADSHVLEEEIPLNIDASPIVTTEEERSSLKRSAALFLLKTKEVHRVTQTALNGIIVSAHRRILGMASVVCVLVKICVSSISLYKLDPDKLTTPIESAHQFTLVCTVSDSKTVPGCHYNSCPNHSFVLTD